MRCFNLEKKSNIHEDQAAELKKIFEEVEQNEVSEENEWLEVDAPLQEVREIDILNLPPRKDVHNEDTKRARLNLGKPFIRLISVIITLMVIIAGSYYLWGEELLIVIKDL